MTIAICLIAIFAVLFLSWKFKIQAGILGGVAALIIGTLLLDLKANTILGYWPISMLFYMTIITFFYGFAQNNGTLDVFAQKLLRLVRGRGALLVPIICVLCILLGFSGAQPIPIVAPIVFTIGAAVGLNPVALVVILSSASEIGSGNPLTGGGGIISTNLIAEAGYANYVPMGYAVWMGSAFKHILFIAFVYVVFKCWKAASAEHVMLGEPPKFNKQQKTNMAIICGCMAYAVVFQMLGNFIKGNVVISMLSKLADANIVFMVGIVLCIVFGLGDTRKAVARIPQNTIIIVGGMTLLMKVAGEAGMVDAVAGVIGGSIPTFLIPGALVLFAGFMSFFAGGVSVVCPLLYPMVPALAAVSGHNDISLFVCVFVGAMCTAVSPFSTAGAQLLGCMLDDETQDRCYMPMMLWACGNCIVFAILACLGLFNIMNWVCAPV